MIEFLGFIVLLGLAIAVLPYILGAAIIMCAAIGAFFAWLTGNLK